VVINLLARLFAIKLVRDRMKAKKGQPPTPVRSAGPSRSPAPRGATYDESSIRPQRAGEPGPDTPLELDAPDWKETSKRTLTEIKSDRITLIAAGMAYYLFFAIFPALIAFTGILGLFEIDTQPIVDAIRTNFPGESGSLLVSAVQGSQKTSDSTALTATILGIAVALWSASSGFVALQKGLNVAYDVPEDRKFVGARLVALALVVATGLLGGVPSPIFVFGDEVVFTIIGWVLTVVAVTILFSLFYYLGPNRGKPTWQWVSAGGLVGAFIWIASSVGFFLYAGDSSRYAATYGSTGAVIALIFWLWLTSLSILVGGELNAELERQAEKRKGRSPK
jgi:membrane protein